MTKSSSRAPSRSSSSSNLGVNAPPAASQSGLARAGSTPRNLDIRTPHILDVRGLPDQGTSGGPMQLSGSLTDSQSQQSGQSQSAGSSGPQPGIPEALGRMLGGGLTPDQIAHQLQMQLPVQSRGEACLDKHMHPKVNLSLKHDISILLSSAAGLALHCVLACSVCSGYLLLGSSEVCCSCTPLLCVIHRPFVLCCIPCTMVWPDACILMFIVHVVLLFAQMPVKAWLYCNKPCCPGNS